MSLFEEYVDQYGRHFNEKLYHFAVSKMKDKNGNVVQPMTKDQVTDFLKTNGVVLENAKGHDAAYVLAMAMSDYRGSSLQDDMHLSLFVKDFLEDPDGTATKAFDHFVVDCRAKDDPIFWDEVL